ADVLPAAVSRPGFRQQARDDFPRAAAHEPGVRRRPPPACGSLPPPLALEGGIRPRDDGSRPRLPEPQARPEPDLVPPAHLPAAPATARLGPRRPGAAPKAGADHATPRRGRRP